MTKTPIVSLFVLFIVTSTVVTLAYPNNMASARKLTGANHISAPHTTNCHGDVCKLTGANHISTSHTTSCDGTVCQMQVCINNKCLGSKQESNSTIPWNDDDQ
jgi:hypothetical protein